MLGSTIVGFHTQFHCNNFIEGVDRFVESRIDREVQTVSLGGHETRVRAYPISIEWPPRELEKLPPPTHCRSDVVAQFGLAEGTRLIVGVERFDYTKGILDRMRAVLDDAVLDRPAFAPAVLEIQVAEIHARPEQAAEGAIELAQRQPGGREQAALREFE